MSQRIERVLKHPEGIQHFISHVADRVKRRRLGEREPRQIKIVAIHQGDKKILNESNKHLRVK